MRVAFYSHDSYGLGHLRRTLRLAAGIGRAVAGLRGLIVTGSGWSHLFPPPDGVELAHLLPMVKTGPRRYEPRRPGVDARDAIAVRRRQLLETLDRFSPDLLVVDNVPCGLAGELRPVLARAKGPGGPRVVLALRDIVDEGATVRAEWADSGAYAALEECYDEVWVFGDADACDPRRHYALSEAVASRLVFCGRIGVERLDPVKAGDHGPRDRRRVLVTGGGGGDAGPMVELYCRALRHAEVRPHSDIVLGPDFPACALPSRLDTSDAEVSVSRFCADLPGAISRADTVVSMAGYNTTSEILDAGTPAVLLPRVWPRREQWLRANALAAAGRAQCLDLATTTPEKLWASIERALEGPRAAISPAHGARVAGERAAELLKDGCRAA